MEYPAPPQARRGGLLMTRSLWQEASPRCDHELEMVAHGEHDSERGGMIYILRPHPERRYSLNIYFPATREEKMRPQ